MMKYNMKHYMNYFCTEELIIFRSHTPYVAEYFVFFTSSVHGSHCFYLTYLVAAINIYVLPVTLMSSVTESH